MNAVPPAHERPTLESARRRDWKAWILQEWGLLLLAAALAWLIWDLTSQRVISLHPLAGVEVRLEVDPALEGRVGAVLTSAPQKLKFDFHCSEREFHQAREALDVDGRPLVTLRVTQPPPRERQVEAGVDHYAWPFHDHERILDRSTPVPAGYVFALAPARPRVGWQDADAATKPSIPAMRERQIGVRVELSMDAVELRAPASQSALPGWKLLQPDPIDLSPLLAVEESIPFDKPQSIPLTFEGWRGGGDREEYRAWRRSLALPEIRATVTLIQLGEATLRNRVVFQLPEALVGSLDRNKIEGLLPTGPLTFAGKLHGPKAVLDALEKDPAGWAWGVEITNPEALAGIGDAQPGESRAVSGKIIWYPTKAAYLDRGVRFEPEPGADACDVSVQSAKRKP